MSRTISMMALVLSILGLAFAASAQASAQAADQSFFTGVVIAVDSTTGELRVEEASLEGPRETFTITQDTTVTRNESAIGLEEIQIGDPVAVAYTGSGPDRRVVSVKVITLPSE